VNLVTSLGQLVVLHNAGLSHVAWMEGPVWRVPELC